MALIDDLENRLLTALAPVLGPIRGLISIVARFKETTVGTFTDAVSLFTEIEQEWAKIKNFTVQPHWKNRVISVPLVVNNLTVLAKVPGDIFIKLRDLFKLLKTKVQPATFNVEELEGLEDLRGLFGRLGPRVAQGFEKVLGVLALLLDVLVTIHDAINDLKSVVDDLRTITDDLDHLDGLFLQQRNPRKTISSADGPLKLRIGHLHKN